MAGGAGGGGAAEITLERTPTWIVASVCSVIVLISLLFERLLHRLGKRLTKGRRKPLYEALLKVKEELMLLGFISLLLTVFQGATQKICVRESLMQHLLPCPRNGAGAAKSVQHYAAGATVFTGVGKVPILSIQAIHQLHIFIFVLAATHVILSAITIILGITQRSFFKQFYGSVTEEDYTTLRLGFVMKHSKGHLKFNFYNYMNRALEGDFKKVVGISWYLWAMLMIFLLLNVHGWHVYIWISIAPFILLLLVGSKLEHIITELAIDVAQKNTAIEGELVVALSDEFFWFHRPKLVLLLIHIILFQNAFEIAFFFWLLVTYGFKSCIMGKPAYAIARLVISVIGQLLCGYSTLPLYALISQMGSSFKKAMFDESISEGLANWAHKARKRNTKPAASVGDNSSVGEEIQMTNARRESAI
uniref:MLO-like protein n=1 Tax=Aegilops tauschii TaxID=37682 RepID=M8C5M6_AEGTA